MCRTRRDERKTLAFDGRLSRVAIGEVGYLFGHSGTLDPTSWPAGNPQA